MKKKLDSNWLTEGLLDFEYKKYVLLAYLKFARKEFDDRRLYPVFADLIFHYRNLKQLQENKKKLTLQFPKKLSEIDIEKLRLRYREIIEDDETMKLIEEVAEFAVPRMQDLLSNGQEIYEHIDTKLEVHPIGLFPTYFREGYVLLHPYMERETKVYRYEVTIYEESGERFRGIRWHYLESLRKSLTNTFENIKLDLVKRYQTFSNPATFAVIPNVYCPLNEALIPVAKRRLTRCIADLENGLTSF